MLNTYEAAGAVMAGTMAIEELDALERAAVPTFGACPGQFTANTMGMVSEMLGLARLGSSMIPAVFEARAALARSAGQLVMRLLKDGGPLPRAMAGMCRAALVEPPVAATIAQAFSRLARVTRSHEAGIRFTLDDVAAVFERTPLIGNLRPGGEYHAQDVHAAGAAVN
jgi:dihydroxy-acid dehydratase